MTVMAIVRIIESIIMASGLSHSEKVFLVQAAKNAPGTVIESFPRKKAEKNLTGLYFISPKGITTGSSGIGEAAATKRRRGAHRLVFCASASSR